MVMKMAISFRNPKNYNGILQLNKLYIHMQKTFLYANFETRKNDLSRSGAVRYQELRSFFMLRARLSYKNEEGELCEAVESLNYEKEFYFSTPIMFYFGCL